MSLVRLIINHPLLVVVQLSNFTTKNYWQAPIIISLGSQFSFPFVVEHITMVQSHHPYGLYILFLDSSVSRLVLNAFSNSF